MNYRYVLFYRLQGERPNTAHMVLVTCVRDAKEELASISTPITWASLCNDNHEEFRDTESLR